jgi:nicotinate-nucleotide pyrophosphorylase (carboxylating)
MKPLFTADAIARRLTWNDLDPAFLAQAVDRARAEDLEGLGLRKAPQTTGDLSAALLPPDLPMARAQLVARERLVLCGLPLVPVVLGAYASSASFVPHREDGSLCEAGTVIGDLSGFPVSLLQAERVLLNFLQYLSGIATLTRTFVESMGPSRTRLLDTRKTTPGYRMLEKVAVATGGGFNHRLGLFERVMIKDNHLAAAGATHGKPLADFLLTVRNRWPESPIELEVDHLEQITPALEAGVDMLMLDNFTEKETCEAVDLINGRAITEASGAVTLERLPWLAQLGLDFISTGATVHKAVWKDIALDWE